MSSAQLREVWPITVVNGAQWGSEAKGSVTAALTLFHNFDIVVRTGTVNAGHTVYYGGKPYAMQQLPVSWIRPETRLYLGPGAYIHPEILAREIRWIWDATGYDPRPRIYIDHRCGLHLPSHTMRAQSAGRHYLMGATGKGCSEAVMSKIRDRGTPDGRLFTNWLDQPRNTPQFKDEELLLGLNVVDTVAELNACWDQGARIMVEGTQGTLLDLHTGPYPYTTHKQTLPANWMAEAGLSPALPVEVISVARTYPIRVAGNSGPMPQEIGWPTLAREINAKLEAVGHPPLVEDWAIREFEDACVEVAAEYVAGGNMSTNLSAVDLWQIENWSQDVRAANQKFVSELHRWALERMQPDAVEYLRNLFELTTVTKKLRRVARLDLDQLRYSCMLNRPTCLALTFVNYEFPETWGRDWMSMGADTAARVDAYCVQLSKDVGYPIGYISTGPLTEHVLPRAAADSKVLGQWPVRRRTSKMAEVATAAGAGSSNAEVDR